MDILQYFDSNFKAQTDVSNISKDGKIVLIVYIEDLLKLANDRLSDELNWIVDCIQSSK